MEARARPERSLGAEPRDVILHVQKQESVIAGGALELAVSVPSGQVAIQTANSGERDERTTHLDDLSPFLHHVLKKPRSKSLSLRG
jgi:hypothetical protein